eukprot:RCo011360
MPMAAEKGLKGVYVGCCEQLGCRPKPLVMALLPECPRELRELELRDHIVGVVGVIPVLAAVKKAPELTYLGLSGNGLDNSSIEALVTAIGSHTALRCIDLSHNRISEAGGRVLKEFLSNHTTLTALNLSETLVSPAMQRSLSRLLTVNADRLARGEELHAQLLKFPNQTREGRNRLLRPQQQSQMPQQQQAIVAQLPALPQTSAPSESGSVSPEGDGNLEIPGKHASSYSAAAGAEGTGDARTG